MHFVAIVGFVILGAISLMTIWCVLEVGEGDEAAVTIGGAAIVGILIAGAGLYNIGELGHVLTFVGDAM